MEGLPTIVDTSRAPSSMHEQSAHPTELHFYPLHKAKQIGTVKYLDHCMIISSTCEHKVNRPAVGSPPVGMHHSPEGNHPGRSGWLWAGGILAGQPQRTAAVRRAGRPECPTAAAASSCSGRCWLQARTVLPHREDE